MRPHPMEASARPPCVAARARRLQAACLAAAIWVGAQAQEADTVVLDPLTIAGTREAAGAAAELRVVAVDRRTGGVGTLPTLASQVAGLPGVVAQESLGGFDPPRLTVRGSGLQSAPVSRGVWWTLDGVPLNAADGSFHAAAIDLSLAGRIAAAPGAGDPAAAVSALGGALQLASPDPAARPTAWAAFGQDGYERLGTHLPDAGACLQANPSSPSTVSPAGRLLHVQAGLSHAAWDGWRPQSAQRRLAASAAVATRLGEHGPAMRLSLYAAMPRFDVPGPLTLSAAKDTPQTISTMATADRPRRETDFGRLALDLTWAHDTRDFTRLACAAQRTDDWFRQLRANGIAATKGDDFTALLETTRTAGAHALRVGLLARSGARDQTRWINTAGSPGARFAALELEASHAVFGIDDRWDLGHGVLIEPGLSALDATREAAGTPAGAAGRSETREIAPRLGLSWQAGEALILSARAARGLEAPTFDDLLVTRGAPAALTVGWAPLRAQRSDTLELGVSGRLGAWTYTCTGYTARWEDELLRLADGSGATLGTVNAGRTDHRGLEAALRWRLWGDARRALDLSATHTWSEATFEDDAAHRGRRLAGLPPHAGRAQLAWSGESGPFATVEATWIGGTTWADHANTLGYAGHTFLHLRAGWSDRRGWAVQVDVDNLLDRASIASTSGVIDLPRNPAATALFLPGLPRQVRVSVSWRH